MEFLKYHGLGNDFIFVEDFDGELIGNAVTLAKKLCDRHFGIGADGLVFITKPREHYTMRIFNADGTEAEMCGNAIRCIAKHLIDQGYVSQNQMIIETLNSSQVIYQKNQAYTVDMGEPIWEPAKIPMKVQGVSLDHTIEVAHSTWKVSAVSMGNPHGVVIVPDIHQVPLEIVGPALETHHIFPSKANIEFVQIVDTEHICIRVWERGVGPTLACGTGACASVAVTAKLGLTKKTVVVSLPGGDLHIEWKQDNHLWMTGPATLIYTGEVSM